MSEQDNGAEQSPESRLYAAGFTRRLDFWAPPGEDRSLNMDDAIAMLDAGEVKPARVPEWPGIHPDAVVGFQPPSDEQMDRWFRPPPPTEPPPLPEWAEPWAELVAEKLKPTIRKEIRAAVKAEARKQAQEPKA
jgi:hypothetical protein